jgi:anti-sigma-K factor RskA
MQFGIGSHLEETELEQYSMGTLSEDSLEAFEEHLLACCSCQDRLLEFEVYVNAMRSASPKLREARQPFWDGLFRLPRPVWLAASAMAVVALAVALVWIVSPSTHQQIASVALQSGRGIEGLATAKAPAGKLLSLTVDLTELPAFPSYRMAIVGARGTPVWEGVAHSAGRSLTQVTNRSLATGQYYVRLYAPGGALLREFSLGID